MIKEVEENDEDEIMTEIITPSLSSTFSSNLKSLSSEEWNHTYGEFLAKDNRVSKEPLGHSLRLFARTAHYARLLAVLLTTPFFGRSLATMIGNQSLNCNML